jgi:hypothetical protein
MTNIQYYYSRTGQILPGILTKPEESCFLVRKAAHDESNGRLPGKTQGEP